MQKIGAQYVAKKFYDQVMAPPKAVEDEAEAAPAAGPAAAAPVAGTDGQLIQDEDGQTIGRAFRVPAVNVFVICEPYADRAAALRDCLAEPDYRTFFQTDDAGRLTGVIYAPDPSRMPAKATGMRADDV